jgi:hypothetical protein
MAQVTQKVIQTTQLNHLIASPVTEFCKRANRPDIFKLNMTPKFHFYRDQIGEKMIPKQSPSHFSYSIIKGLD